MDTTPKLRMQKLQLMESVKLPINQNEPKIDTYKIAYIIHFMLGAGNLLPWNALITAVDYFTNLYPSKHVEKVFSVAYMCSSLLTLVLIISCGSCVKKLSFRVRMNIGFLIFILSIMVTPVADWCWGSSGAYDLTVGSVVFCGLADGLIGGSLIGFAGKLPEQYMQAVFAGTASSGVLVSILRIITKSSLPQTTRGLQTSTYFYFIVTMMILLACVISCNLLYKLPIMNQYYKHPQGDNSNPTPGFLNVAEKIRLPAFGIFLIYTITLSIFPGFIAESLASNILKDWYPILLITIYNISDFIGKSLTAVWVLDSIKKATWACIGRIFFYPFFTICLHGPGWLKTEMPMVFLTILLGLTNGYLTSVIMILTPKSVPVSEAEVSATVMALFLGLGLVSGSVLGWVWII